LPHKFNLRRGEGVGLVDEVAVGALSVQGFGGEGAGGGDGAGVFVPQSVDPGGGQGKSFAPDAIHFADLGVGIEVGSSERVIAGLCNPCRSASKMQLGDRTGLG
jgi:hypothetical protein